MATPNPSSDCSDSEQSHMKINSPESLAGDDLPDSHTFHKETKTTLKGNVCHQETTTFHEGYVVGSSVNGHPTVEGPEDTGSLGRCMDNNSDTTKDNPNQAHIQMYPDVEEDEETDSDSEGEVADQIVTNNNKWINKNLRLRGLYIDPVDGWPVIQLVSPKLTKEQAPEDSHNEERKEESESSEDEYGDADKLIENFKDQDEGMLMGLIEKEKEDTKIKNNEDTWSDDEEYVDLYERMLVYKISDDTRLPDSSEDDGRQLNESSLEKENIPDNEDPQDADKQTYDSDKDDALWLREPPEGNFQLGSSSPPHPAQVPCEEHHTCEDLPTCKPPENTQVTQVPEMPAMLPEDEPAEPQDLTETEYNYNFMATPNPSSDCSDSEQSHMKINFPESLVGGDLPDSHTFHKETKTTLKGNVCHQETTTFHEGYVVGSSVNGRTTVEGPEDTQSLGRCMDNNSDTTKDNPNQARIQMYPDVEEDEETDSDSEGEGADQIVTNNNKWINKNLRLRGLYTDPVDSWPVIQLVSPKLTEEQAPEDSHNEERKEESESSEDEHGDADKLIENFKDQEEGMLMGLTEKEKEDTKIKNNEDTWSDDEEYVDLYERMLVYKISDDTRLPDSSEDDGRQLNESSLEKENIPDNEDPQDADKQTYDSDKDDALWLREPPEGNFQLGSSSPPHPAQVPCEEHHTCEDLPTCKPPENTQVTQVPEMPAMLPEDEPAEPQDLTETEYNYNFMATPNPSSDCSDSEQSHMKINFPESLVGGDLPDSHTFHKETKTTLKGNVCHQETTTFHEGYVVGSSVNGHTTVEGPEDTQSLGRCMDNNSDTTKDNPNQARIQMYPDVEEDEETDSDSEGEGADQIVTNNNKWINKNLRLRGLYTDPVDSWPVIQLVSPKLTEEQAPEDSHNEERKEESESSEDEHGDADKLIENFKDQDEGMLMGLTEKEKEDTKIKNNEDTWSDDEEYVDLYERTLVYKISDDTRLPDSSEDDGRQLNESSLEKENIPDNEDPQDADKQTYDSDKNDALWLREPPEGNFQLGSSSPPHPAQVPCEEHHTCEDLPTCKPPENTQVTQVPEMPAMLPEDEPAEPQDLTETEYNYNFMATPNPSSDCSDSEQSHMKINFPESLVGGDLPDSHTFHKETKTTLKGNVCHQETTTFHEGYVVGSSVNGRTTVEGPEDTQSLGRCMDNNSDTTKDNPNQARIQMYPDVEEDEETDSDSEGEGADQIVTNNNKWINKNLRLRELYTDPVDSWPVIQLVSPKLTKEQAPEDSHNEERKEESESSEDEYGDADKLIENFKDQDEGMLMGLIEKEKEDTKIKNNEDTWSDDEEYVDLYERMLVYKISDDTRLPDSSEDDGRQLNESSLEKENIPDNEDPQDADKQTYDSDKDDALWLREPPEGNFQLGSSSPPHPAQVPCEEHHTCEDLPTCKPPENTQVTQVPEMPAMLPEDEPAEPQDLTETEYNYNFMATPNPSSDCSDSEQSHMKINFPESLVGGDLPDSHTFHKETKTTLKGNVCHQETTTFHEGYVVGSSVNGRTTVEGPEDTQSLGRCMDNNSDTTKDNPNQARIQMYPDVEEDEETDSDSEGEGADQIVTNNNKWINKNLRLRGLYTDPVDSWPVIQLVSPKLTEEQAPEDSHNEERKEESESSEDEHGDADKLIENFKDQEEGMLMGLTEKEKEDTKIKNNEDTWSDDEEYVDLYERMLVYKISDDTRLPDSSEDDGRQLNESSLEKENIPDNEDPQDADKQTYDSDKDDALWLREPPEGNFQLGSSSPPHPAQVPCEEHHTCEDLPTCKPPENTQVTQVPEMPAMLPEDEPAEPQDLTETEYNYNFMATPNPSSDCSDSEQSHMKINFPESLVGGDLPDSHTFHKETKTTLKGNVCHQETTTFHEGYVVGSSVNGHTTVEGPEDTQSLGRCMDNNSDTTKDNPNQARIQMYPDVEEDEETDSDSEGEGADQIVTNNNKWINKNLRLRGLYTDPVDSWPVIQLVSPKLTEEQAPEDSHNEERKEESESSEDEHGDADKLIENFKDQDEGMLMGLTEKEKEDTKIKNNEDTWSDDEEYVDLYERTLVYKISDDTRLPDSSEDDGRQLNESSLEKENIPDNEDPQDADKQTYDSDKNDALWLREPPEGNFQLGSSSPPHPAQVPCEEHHTCEDLPTCKPPENTQVTQVPEMPAMLPEDEPAEPQDLTETEYNYNFMATPNPSSDCSDSEQSHMKINFPESLVGGDLPDSHTFHKETKTTLKGNVCHQETTTFHEGYVVGSSVNGRTTVEGPEDTQSLGRCMDNNSDTTKDNPNQARIQMYPDVEEDEETDSDSEGEGADQIVTNNNKWINKNLRLRELYTDPVDSWPVIQLVSPKLTEEQAPEDSHNEERKEESESSGDEYGDADKLIENCKDQDEGMLMGLIEKEKEDTKIKNNEDTWSDDEEYVDLYERMLVYKISDDTRLPDSSEDDGRQLNESSLEKENIPDNEDPQDADKQTYDSDKDDALWLREPPEGNFQLGSSSPPHPAQVPCEEHHTCEDLPTCKPPENTQVTQVPEMPAMLPEDEPAEPQDLTETEYNYNFMATPNPSSDCSDSEQSHMKINFPESLVGGDLPDSHTFHKETKITLKGNVCHQETTTFHEGYVVGSSVNGRTTVEGPEDTQSLGRCMDNNSDTTKDNPNQARIQMYPDVEEDEETDSDSEGEGADQIVTNNNKWINKNLRLRGLFTDPVDSWPVIQLVSPKLTEEQAPEDSHNEERKEESESSEDEHGDADKLIENFKDQDEGMLMGLTEKEKEDTKIKNNEDTWSDDEEYVDLYERMLVYKISDDTRLPDSSEDDGRQLNESSLEKENIPDNEDPQDADKQTYDSDKDDALWLREPPEGNFQLGSSSPPHPAQVPCEEHHTCEDLPTCKPPENTQVTQVPEMPAMLPEDEPAEMLKTSTKESSSVSLGESEDDDTGSDTQTTTCVNWRQAFRWLRKRVLSCMGRRVTVRNPPATPTKKSLPTSKETHPKETLSD